MKAIPSESDWRSVPWCLDIPYAYANFHGKTLSEARQLFVDNALRYQEDLMWMPIPCFHFYIDAYIDYLMSDASIEDCDGASCFFGLVRIRFHDIMAGGESLVVRVTRLLDRLASHQPWYAADFEIYGDFANHAAACRKLILANG